MNSPTPLSAARHASLRFNRDATATTRRFVQLGLSEIALAAADMPLCFAKDAGTGRFNLIALLGLVEPANLFSANGRVNATYLPRAAALSCFRLDAGGAGGLSIDEGDAAVGAVGEPLFDGTVPAPLLERIRGGLEDLIADVAAAAQLVERYVEQRLVRPLYLTLRQEDGHEQVLDGLYSLDATAVKDLTDRQVIDLHRADALLPAGVLTSSLAQVERLRQLHNAQFMPRISDARLAMQADK
jgi:hypothetical protein